MVPCGELIFTELTLRINSSSLLELLLESTEALDDEDNGIEDA